MDDGGERLTRVTASRISHTPPSAAPGPGARPELADLGRLARRALRRAVSAARAEEASVAHLIAGHLGPGADAMSVVSGAWPRYDQVNVQAGVDAWLARPGRGHEVIGLTGFHHAMFGLADLARANHPGHGIGVGNVTTELLPAGPGGQTKACVQCALYLVTDADGPLALLLRAPAEHGPVEGVVAEVAGPDPGRAQRALDDIRALAVRHNVFRGHVVAFGGEVFGRGRGGLLSFLERPHVAREEVILPDEVLDGVERQVLGVARHAGRLLASGQHLKRGVLLHGPPGTGKTHTIRYLLSELRDVTVVVLSGPALRMIGEACSVARTLQPAVIVVEDVDLIAEHREFGMGQHPLLFQLLNEMDGLGEDLNVTFVLTTNRPDLLEPALAARPGRVDHAALLPMPDAGARRRLIRLYQGNLTLDVSGLDQVIARTEGVTASFMKELLRRAALAAADDPAAHDPAAHDPAVHDPAAHDPAAHEPAAHEPAAGGAEAAAAPLRVTDAHLSAALDQLLGASHELTRVLLGGQPGGRSREGSAADEGRLPGQPRRGAGGMGADAVIRGAGPAPRPGRSGPAAGR